MSFSTEEAILLCNGQLANDEMETDTLPVYL